MGKLILVCFAIYMAVASIGKGNDTAASVFLSAGLIITAMGGRNSNGDGGRK